MSWPWTFDDAEYVVRIRELEQRVEAEKQRIRQSMQKHTGGKRAAGGTTGEQSHSPPSGPVSDLTHDRLGLP